MVSLISRSSSAALSVVATLALSLFASRATSAQQGTFALSVGSAAEQVPKVPAMISVLRDGELVAQNEVLLGTRSFASWSTSKLAPGLYDVRVEAEGLLTEAKRGVRILPNQELDLTFLMRVGRGAHVVEYAAGGLAREEVATRLAAVEGGLTKLATSVQGQATWGDPCCIVTILDQKRLIATAVNPATKQAFSFRASTFEPIDGAKLVASLKVGQKIWRNTSTGMISVDGGAPCCTVIQPAIPPL